MPTKWDDLSLTFVRCQLLTGRFIDMQIYSAGIDHIKTTFHLVGGTLRRQDGCEQEVHSEAAAGLHREHAELADRLGDLLRRSLRKPSTAEAGA
jgi:hypothetical protein